MDNNSSKPQFFAAPVEAGIARLYRQDGPSKSQVAMLVMQKPEEGKPEQWELLIPGEQPVMLEGSVDEATEQAIASLTDRLRPKKAANPGLEKANAAKKAKKEAKAKTSPDLP